jgi:hypothetical protein
MPPSLQSLLPPLTADDVEPILLGLLSGVGPVLQVGTGTGTVVPTGSPVAAYDVQVIVGTGGPPGSATIIYSLDGGLTTQGPFSVPASGTFDLSGTGVQLQLAGTFLSGDVYSFITIFPVFPVTSWASGDNGLTLVKMESAMVADLVGSAIANVAGGGFVDYASDRGAPNDWLSLLSHELYQNDRNLAGTALGKEQLTLVSTGRR